MSQTPTPPYAPVIPQPKKGWWGRNWKWFVPTGCLAMILLCAGGLGVIVMTAFSIIKNSDVYKQAVNRVQSDPRVEEQLGTPIKAGYLIRGKIQITNDTGHAEIQIPISGPRGKAMIHVRAEKRKGRWEFNRLEVEIDKTGVRINLLSNEQSETFTF